VNNESNMAVKKQSCPHLQYYASTSAKEMRKQNIQPISEPIFETKISRKRSKMANHPTAIFFCN